MCITQPQWVKHYLPFNYHTYFSKDGLIILLKYLLKIACWCQDYIHVHTCYQITEILTFLASEMTMLPTTDNAVKYNVRLMPYHAKISDTKHCKNPWWRHEVETFSALLAFCEGNHRSPVDSLHNGPVMRNFDVSFDVSLRKRLNKQLPLLLALCGMSEWNFGSVTSCATLFCLENSGELAQ